MDTFGNLVNGLGQIDCSLWNTLKNEVKGALGTSLEKKVAAYAQYLRATGRPFALATAWTDVGSFTPYYEGVKHGTPELLKLSKN